MKKEIDLQLKAGIYSIGRSPMATPVLCTEGLLDYVELPDPLPRKVVLVLTTDKPKGNKYHILKGNPTTGFENIKARRPDQRKWSEPGSYWKLDRLIEEMSGDTTSHVYAWLEYDS